MIEDIAVVTCIGSNRYNITKLWYEQIKTQFKYIYAASSIPLDIDIKYTLHSSVPLSDKFNYALKLAYDAGHQWFLITGDDDFFNNFLLSEYRMAINNNHLWFGSTSVCILDYFTKESRLFTYGETGRVTGAGTVIHRSLIEFPMWSYGMFKSIDMNFHHRLIHKGYSPHLIKTEGMLTDIKFNNIWPYSFFSSLPLCDGLKNIYVPF